MNVDRFSVTMEPELGAAVREAAARSGVSVSRWISDAASDHLRNELLGAALGAWEAEDGAFTDTELDDAARRLGWRSRAGRNVDGPSRAPSPEGPAAG
jgi:hypothetical protein